MTSYPEGVDTKSVLREIASVVIKKTPARKPARRTKPAPAKKSFRRATGILMGKTGRGKTSALALAFPRYAWLMTAEGNLEGFESIVDSIEGARVPTQRHVIHLETLSGKSQNIYVWYRDHYKRVRMIMQKRATSEDPRVRRTLAGEIARGWKIPEEEPVPGIVVSEYSTLFDWIQKGCDAKYPNAGWKTFGRTQTLPIKTLALFERYGLGLWWEMHVAEEDPERGYERGPRTPTGPFRSKLAESMRNVWEIEAIFNREDESQERHIWTRASEESPMLKTRIAVPAKLDLTVKTMAHYIREAGLPVN